MSTYGVSFGKFQRSKVHGKCVQMCIRPFTKLGCNPCLIKELQPNYLYIKSVALYSSTAACATEKYA